MQLGVFYTREIRDGFSKKQFVFYKHVSNNIALYKFGQRQLQISLKELQVILVYKSVCFFVIVAAPTLVPPILRNSNFFHLIRASVKFSKPEPLSFCLVLLFFFL